MCGFFLDFDLSKLIVEINKVDGIYGIIGRWLDMRRY